MLVLRLYAGVKTMLVLRLYAGVKNYTGVKNVYWC